MKTNATAAEPGAPPGDGRWPRPIEPQVILSFDVEEHDRIEAASGLDLPESLRRRCRERVGPPTRWLLDLLERLEIRATFFIVGQVAEHDPGLVRAIQGAGHEVASHSHAHKRIHALTPDQFREDLRRSKDALEQVIGQAVVGYRAPTFSVVRRTAWAIDVLVEEGFRYDSSVFPVRHDRYGVPKAPRDPFLARGHERTILELPPTTLNAVGARLPIGGGGYFRLLPTALLERALTQVRSAGNPPVAMLYFHPWEFDPDGPRLPLRRLSRFRTYVGIGRSRDRLAALLTRHRFARAVDVADRLEPQRPTLPCHEVGS